MARGNDISALAKEVPIRTSGKGREAPPPLPASRLASHNMLCSAARQSIRLRKQGRAPPPSASIDSATPYCVQNENMLISRPKKIKLWRTASSRFSAVRVA